MEKIKNIEAVILAGGKSSRMGSEKGLVLFNNIRFIDRIVETLQEVFEKVSIISNTNQYNYLGFPVFEDEIKDKGPLAGIYTALKNTTLRKIFVVSCDIPFISADLLRFICVKSIGYEITVPSHQSKTEPLCGVYSLSCKDKLKLKIINNQLSVNEAIYRFDTNVVDISNEPFYTSFLLSNINTPQEVQEYEQKIVNVEI
jgi:molybdopterin-guanine dinucleotide biosynthesis protein A